MHEIPKQGPARHSEDANPWTYGKYQIVLAALPLANGRTVAAGRGSNDNSSERILCWINRPLLTQSLAQQQDR